METNSNVNTIQLPANMVIDKVEEGEIFLKPAFKDGDVLVSGNSGEPFVYNGKYNIEEDSIGCYIGIGSSRELNINSLSVPTSHWSSFCKARKATEQEKEKLFKAISDAGYVWNEQLKELKELRKELPKTWEEFCQRYPITDGGEYYIGTSSNIETYITGKRWEEKDKNVILGKEKALSMLAFIQLIRLRDCYRNGWKPDLGEGIYYIEYSPTFGLACFYTDDHHRVLSFQSREIRDMFLENFRDLIEQAKEFI